jgi:signal transduction histidine kinase
VLGIKSKFNFREYLGRKTWRGALPYIVIILTVAEGVIDATTPRGLSDWMFFMVPILLTSWMLRQWTTRITITASIFTIVGFFLPIQPLPADSTRVAISIANRVIGIIIFWITAMLINLRRREREKLQRAHEELEVQTQKLIENERQKTEFLADTSHELRAPLAIIKSYLDLASGKKSKKFTDPYKTLRGINTEVKHLSQIIADLMLLARSTAEPHRVLATDEIDLKGVILEVIKKYKQLSENKYITISSTLAAITYRGDREKLTKLFSNLLGNAIQYGKEGGHILITSHQNEHDVTIAFEDDGIGIPEKDLPYIFDRFYRVEKARTRTQGGVGLGLSICKWITEAHGGKITIASVLDKGSTVTVRLPSRTPLQG